MLDLPNDGGVLSGRFGLAGDISPPTLGADVDDWAPTGLDTAAVIRVSGDTGNRRVTGIEAGANPDGRVLIVANVDANPVTLSNEDAASAAANRMALKQDQYLKQNDLVWLKYDITSLRWQVMASGSWTSLGRISETVDGEALRPKDGAAGPEVGVIAGTNNDLGGLLYDGASTERAFYKFKAPAGAERTAAIRFTLVVAPNNAVAGNTRWTVEAAAVSALENQDVNPAASSQGVTIGVSATIGVISVGAPVDVTPVGTWAEGDMIQVRVSRAGGDGADTNSGDVLLASVEHQVTYLRGNDE